MWNEPTQDELANLPALGSTVEIPLNQKIIHMHFFIGAFDWYVAEYDKDEDLFFGYVNLGDDEMAEWGNFSFEELREIKVRVKARNVKRISQSVEFYHEVDRDMNWMSVRFCDIEGISSNSNIPIKEKNLIAEKEQTDIEPAEVLFNKLVKEIPRNALWPVIIGLIQHVLLYENTTMHDYHHGIFAITDTLCDAADLQIHYGADVKQDLRELAHLRKRNLRKM